MLQAALREHFDYSIGSTIRGKALWQGLLRSTHRRKGAKPAHGHCIKDGVFIDDGFSGSDFDRPAFGEMMEDVYNGIINLILVKDLSRFGRNYIKLGELTDFILPTLGCRLVALEDGIDTGSENNEMMHFRSLLNDQYLKDLSKKIRICIHKRFSNVCKCEILTMASAESTEIS